VLSSGEEIAPHMADYFLLSKKQDLPPAGVLGVNLKEKNEECYIDSLTAGGASEKAGLKKGDVVVKIDTEIIRTPADARLVLWNKKPGDRVHVEVHRKQALRPPREISVDIALSTAIPASDVH
jgi:S1-C subfamily serine protease